MDYHVACDNAKSANTEYLKRFGVQGIPHAFIISKTGKIMWHGHPMEDKFEANILQAANEA